MSLYDKASIALIPSGTKASTLYSVLPANGDGDFTHSRSLTTATRVNKDGLIESVAANVPRLDYPLTNGVAGDCPHLLLEPSRTNDMQRTEEFDNAYWTKYDTSVSANQVVSPDGTVTADRILEDTGTSTHQIGRAFSFTSGSYYAVSVFVKENGRNFQITAGNPNTWRGSAIYNLSTGSVQSTTYGTASIEDFGNGWYRCMLVGQALATASTNINFGLISGTSTTSYTGNGSSGVYLWGAQREIGLYPTSYISWDGSGSTTRSADLCNDSGTSAQVNNDAGAFFVEIQALEEGSSASRRITLSDESSSDRIMIETDESTGTFKFFIAGGGTVRTIATSTGNTQTDINKLAIGYDGVNAKAYINGTQVGSITNATTRTGIDTVDIADWNGTSNVYFGRVKQVIVFNEALTDSELATLTS